MANDFEHLGAGDIVYLKKDEEELLEIWGAFSFNDTNPPGWS